MASASGIRAGQAFVELFADDSRLVQGLRAASQRLKAWGQSVTAMGQRILAAGMAAMGGAFAAAKTFASMGDQMAKASQRTGVSVERLSELAYAAEQSGADLGQLETGLKWMQKNLAAAASGSASAQSSLARLGLSIQQLVGLSPDRQFMLIADRMSRLRDPTLRAAVAMEVFGRSGTQLLPMMAEGAKGIEALTDRARQLGLIMSTEDAQAAVVFGDLLSDLWKSIKIGVFTIGSALTPTLTEWVRGAIAVMKSITDWVRSNKELVVSAFKVAAAVVLSGATLITLGGVISAVGAALGVLVWPLKVVGTGMQLVLFAANVGAKGLKLLAVTGRLLGTSLNVVGSLLRAVVTTVGLLGSGASLVVSVLRGMVVAVLSVGSTAISVFGSIASSAGSVAVVAFKVLGVVASYALLGVLNAAILLANGIRAVASTAMLLTSAMRALATSGVVMRTLSAAVGAFLSPISMAAVALAGLATAAIYMAGGWRQALNKVVGVTQAVVAKLSQILISALRAPIRVIANMVVGVWKAITSATKVAWNAVLGVVSMAWNAVYSTASGAINWIASLFASIPSAAASAWQSVQQGASGAVSGIRSAFSTATSWVGSKLVNMKEAAIAVWKDIATTATAAWQGIGEAIAANDLGLAMKIVWLTLKLEWNKLIAWLTEKWSNFKEAFQDIATEAVFSVASIFASAWAAIQKGWVEALAFLSQAFARFTAGISSGWNTIQNWLAKKLVALMGYFDKSIDVEAAQQILDEDFAREQQQRDKSLEDQLRVIETTRQAKNQAIEDEKQGTLAALNQERQRRLDERKERTKAEIQAAQDAVNAAKKEWQASLDAAAQKRREAATPKIGPGGIGGLDLLTARASVVGTFNAMAVGGLGSGSAMERVAHATEETARNTKELNKNFKKGRYLFE